MCPSYSMLSPDWMRLGVSPAQAPTSRERLGGIIDRRLKGQRHPRPTPGTAMKRLQSSSRLAVRTSSAWSLMYSETAPPVPAAPLGQRRQQRAVADQLAGRSLEAGPPDRFMLPPEHLEAVPDFVLQIEELALEG